MRGPRSEGWTKQRLKFVFFVKEKLEVTFKTETLAYLLVFANMQQLINVTANLIVTMTVITKFIVTDVTTNLVITAVLTKLALTAVTTKLVVTAVTTELVRILRWSSLSQNADLLTL